MSVKERNTLVPSDQKLKICKYIKPTSNSAVRFLENSMLATSMLGINKRGLYGCNHIILLLIPRCVKKGKAVLVLN
jgi:hypothetical protein